MQNADFSSQHCDLRLLVANEADWIQIYPICKLVLKRTIKLILLIL